MSKAADAQELYNLLEELRRKSQGSSGGPIYMYEARIKRATTLAYLLKAAIEREKDQ
jgi:hypothetical protein